MVLMIVIPLLVGFLIGITCGVYGCWLSVAKVEDTLRRAANGVTEKDDFSVGYKRAINYAIVQLERMMKGEKS